MTIQEFKTKLKSNPTAITFAETIRETATEVVAHYTGKLIKGEIVVVVEGRK